MDTFNWFGEHVAWMARGVMAFMLLVIFWDMCTEKAEEDRPEETPKLSKRQRKKAKRRQL